MSNHVFGNEGISPEHGSTISHGWNSDMMTERSSIYSLMEDEYDRELSGGIEAMLQNIYKDLFDEAELQPDTSINRECREWKNNFPHFRLTGKQLIKSSETGYDAVTPVGGMLTTLLEEVSDEPLCISGHVAPCQLQEDGEEIFESDGQVEDIYAVDTGKSLSIHKKAGPPLPPVTPQSSFYHNICLSILDVLWDQIINSMRHLLRKYTLTSVPKRPQTRLTNIANPVFVAPMQQSSLADGSQLKGVLTVSSKEIQGRVEGASSSQMTRSSHISTSSSLVSRQLAKVDQSKTLISEGKNDMLICTQYRSVLQRNKTLPPIASGNQKQKKDARARSALQGKEMSILKEKSDLRPNTTNTHGRPDQPIWRMSTSTNFLKSSGTSGNSSAGEKTMLNVKGSKWTL